MKKYYLNYGIRIIVTLLFYMGVATFAAETISLKDKINSTVGRAVFVDSDSLSDKICTWKDVKKWFPPRGKDPLRMPYPEQLKGSGISEEIIVIIIITPEGKVINPQVENLKNKQLAIPAILHLAGLRFQIPKLNGEPVYCQQKVKLICSEDPAFGKK